MRDTNLSCSHPLDFPPDKPLQCIGNMAVKHVGFNDINLLRCE